MKILRIPLLIFLAVVAGRTFPTEAQTVTILYSFGSFTNDGTGPFAALVQGSDSNFYGTTQYGGGNGGGDGYGTVFRISSNGTYASLYSFGRFPNDGQFPVAGLVQGSDGNFYGTTEYGGTNGEGTVFRISPDGNYTNLYSFTGPPNDGTGPFAGLVQGSDGDFYGTTESGGNGPCDSGDLGDGCGIIFRVSRTGSETNLHSFGNSSTDGQNPGGLVMGSDGNFYGTTGAGGANGGGTIFRISPTGTYTSLYSFGNSSTDGNSPDGLVEGSDGYFYGTTSQGGMNTNCFNGCGTVFQISTSGSYTSLYSFGGYLNNDGSDPLPGLVLGSDGDFYGTTGLGGTNRDYGTIFRISSSGSYTMLHSFVGPATDGAYPQAGLVQGSDGNFYGTTSQGGTNISCYLGCGTVFTLDIGLGPLSNSCTYAINATNAVFDATGGSNSVSVTASNGCTWTASTTNTWITITSGVNGFGNGTVYYSVAANTSTNDITGTMTIADQTVTVTQSGTTSSSGGGCAYALSTTNSTLPAKGGSKDVSVKVRGTGCSWSAVSNNPFITITSGSTGTGNGKVNYTVPGNTNATVLTGSMTIAGETFTVNQAAGGCTYKLSPRTGKLKATGGTATIKVNPNFSDCDWTAVSNDGFITITSGASGSGKGSVTYSVGANATTNILTGTIAVAGETFTVTQSGEK